MSDYFISGRSFFTSPGVSSTEIKDELFALKTRRAELKVDLPKEFIELMAKWNGFSILFSLKAAPLHFSNTKFLFEVFSFGKANSSIRNFYEVNIKSISSTHLLIGYSNCYSETENGNSFGDGYIAVDQAGHFWHLGNGYDDFHPSHLIGKSMFEVCDYLFPKTP